MKRVIKLVALVIDVALMPIRVLIALQINICGAIMADLSIKDMVKPIFDQFKIYPSIVKEALENI